MKTNEIKKAFLNTLEVMPKNTCIIVATNQEKEMVDKFLGESQSRERGRVVIQTGAGISNALDSLLPLPHDTPVLNIGFAGSNQLGKSGIFTVKEVRHYHPNVNFDRPEPVLLLTPAPGLEGAICYTSQDFVHDTKITEPVLFDMELAIIARLYQGQPVTSIKIVSDNLDLEEYTDTVSH